MRQADAPSRAGKQLRQYTDPTAWAQNLRLAARFRLRQPLGGLFSLGNESEKNFVASDHPQTHAGALLDGAAAAFERLDFGGNGVVFGAKPVVGLANGRKLRFKRMHSGDPALAEPQRPLNADGKTKEQDVEEMPDAHGCTRL